MKFSRKRKDFISHQKNKAMDEYYNVKRLALVLAVQAEIEGMKSKNSQQIEHQQYTEVDFYNKAEELRILAYAHNEQL